SNLADFILEQLYKVVSATDVKDPKGKVDFSVIDLKNRYNDDRLALENNQATTKDVQEAILYLSKVQALEIEGGFLVCYNALQMKRIEKSNKRRFEKKDFRSLEKNYHAKQHMIHSMKKFAEVMYDSEEKGKELLKDYFGLSEVKFFDKWFEPGYLNEITKNMSKNTYERIFGSLSGQQKKIIEDDQSENIVVLAGPGSGKTKVLVHKLASLLLLERVKSDQLLMLTFSRSAAMEFKERLVNLVGNLGFMVKIQTFHSFCFDILGRVGNLDGSDTVITDAISMIENGEVETSQITKSVLVIDEAQDMDAEQYKLVQLLMKNNEDLRVIAVGDDDQNIYEFRNSSSEYMKKIIIEHNASQYELLENYRSLQNIVSFTNNYVDRLPNRLKRSPITAVNLEPGLVKVYKHAFGFMEVPLVDQLLRDHYTGTKAVLTATNRGTYFLIGKLIKDGIQAHLVQSNDGFRIFDLYGIRCFYNEIRKHFDKTDELLISEEIWTSGRTYIDTAFGNSEDHSFINSVIDRFESLNPEKYISDLYEYLVESKMEDFEDEEQDAVVVSTMHRAKGKEFDNVYLLLERKKEWSEQDLRVLYVAMTRAKKTLTIFTNDEYISFGDDHAEMHIDNDMYPSTNSLVMQLSYDGVVLSRFEHYQELITGLRSGDHLQWNNSTLFYDNVGIAMLSKKAKGNVQKLLSKGFEVYDVTIRHIVFWKSKDTEKELLIVFPDLYFRRNDAL
ncbi:MAG: ATP-dependent helicase, partial [Butyrivibrio sp.]|nr:ATP-dependent helicase [Butyrivibrio sp.]